MAKYVKINGETLKKEKLTDPKKFHVGEYSKAIAEDAGAMIPVKPLQTFFETITNKDKKGTTWNACKVVLGVHNKDLIITGKADNGQEEMLVVKKGYEALKARKAVVINADPGDDKIDSAAKDMGNAKKVKVDTLASADLSSVTGDVIILAHGGSTGSSPGKVYCNGFAKKSASDIVKYLVKTKPLPLSYSGVVYLDGCFTAAGASKGRSLSDLNNFAGKVYKGMLAAGYKHLQVKGNLGLAGTNEDGTETILDAQAEAAIRKNKKKLKPFDDAVMKAEAEWKRVANNLGDTYGRQISELDRLIATGSEADKKQATEARATVRAEMAAEIAKAEKKYRKVRESWAAAYRKVGVPTDKIKELVGTFGPAELPS